MSTSRIKKASSHTDNEVIADIHSIKVGIVQSQWNEEITNKLLEGAKETLLNKGVLMDNLFVHQVPGAFELPLGAKFLLNHVKLDAVICLGCVIKGHTDHDKYINHAVANGITQLGLLSNIPIIYGVLTPNNEEQALERAGGLEGNKGAEAAQTALSMIQLKKNLNPEKKSIGY
jgi:6,7-dimethyl-8-ribityllumazine synthase